MTKEYIEKEKQRREDNKFAKTKAMDLNELNFRVKKF